jgi:hypothetical protein
MEKAQKPIHNTVHRRQNLLEDILSWINFGKYKYISIRVASRWI